LKDDKPFRTVALFQATPEARANAKAMAGAMGSKFRKQAGPQRSAP
jgi:hypothetical protein